MRATDSEPIVMYGNPALAVPVIPTNQTGGSSNQATATVSPSNTPAGVGSSTVRTAGSNLLNAVTGIITNPFQHVVGAVILVLVGWWIYKHWIK